MPTIDEMNVKLKIDADTSKAERKIAKLGGKINENIELDLSEEWLEKSVKPIKDQINNYANEINTGGSNFIGDADDAGRKFSTKISKSAADIALVFKNIMLSIADSARYMVGMSMYEGDSDLSDYYSSLIDDDLRKKLTVLSGIARAASKSIDKLQLSIEKSASSKSAENDDSTTETPHAAKTLIDQVLAGFGINPSMAVMAEMGVAMGIIVGMIRKILQKNEEIQESTSALMEVFALMLEPVLNFISAIFQAIARVLIRIFKLSYKNTSANEKSAKSLASFDTITNLGNSEGSGSTLLEDLFDTGPLDKYREQLSLNQKIEYDKLVNMGYTAEEAFNMVTESIRRIDFREWIDGVGLKWQEFFTVTIPELFNKFNTWLAKVGSESMEGINKWGRETAALAKELGSTLWTRICEGFKQDFNSISTWFSERIIYPIKQGFISAVNAVIEAINKIPGINITPVAAVEATTNTKLGELTKRGLKLKQLAVGTNYIPNDMIAQLHSGEAVIPKAFNENQFNNSLETNNLLRQLIGVVDSKEFKAYISKNDVGKAAVSYINTQNRILGGSLV